MDSAAAQPPRVLWINARLLHPLNGGDRIRTYHMLRQLKKHCRITYVCPRTPQDADTAVDLASEYCHELISFPHTIPANGTPRFYAAVLWNCLFGSRPFASQKYASPLARRLILDALRNQKFDLIIADYLMSWIHLCDLQPRPQGPMVVFQHNVESLIWRRHADAAANPLRRWICHREWQLTRSFEDHASRHADGQIAVSEDEERMFRDERGMKNILGWVPTGVDCDFFTAPATPPPPATLAFLGSMDWHANVDAIEHFVRHSYPLIKQRCPAARLILIGRNPAPAVRALAATDPSIEVTGTVDDVRPHLARASIMILPLRVGGGTRIKVFEGMAAGLAVVSSRIGVEGLPVVHGEHALLADDPAPFAEAVISLIEDTHRRAAIARHARDWVRAHFSWESASLKFLSLCQPLMAREAGVEVNALPLSAVSPASPASSPPPPSASPVH
jgi:polysaccharide biosynthesis protein PslH